MRAARTSRRCKLLLADESGITALELCLLFPFMIVLFAGTVETTQLVRAVMGLGVATQAMADLLSHGDPNTTAQVTDACNGAKLVLTPFNSSSFKAAVSNVKNTSGTIAVAWTNNSCGTATGMASANAIAIGTPMVPNTGDEVTIVQSSYTYTAATSYVLPGSVSLTSQAFARPRVPPS